MSSSKILSLILIVLAWVILFAILKPIFLICNHEMVKDLSALDPLLVMWYGKSLDLSIACYLSAVPALLIIAGQWIQHRVMDIIRKVYLIFASTLVSSLVVLNMVLYPFWRFPLDSTPLFYFLSSPADAMASVSGWFILLGLVATAFLAAVFYFVVDWCWGKPKVTKGYWETLVMVLGLGLLVLGIRGGVSVSTMNTGEAYFSNNTILNHAAVNPVFSFMDSALTENDFDSQYRFMDDKKAHDIAESMLSTGSNDNINVLTRKRPDIYIVIMEGFSRLVMETPATPELNKLKNEGLFFENFYANSFRTDRGLVAILSGFPAQPTMSIIKYPKKTGRLNSLGNILSQNGYDLKYYYGGDANFTNMRSYLVNMKFIDIVSDSDFPISQRLSKWGVPDGPVFQRMMNDQKGWKSFEDRKPKLTVIQTSSSHEPFDVPYHRLNNPCLNAFAYSDHCVGNFIAHLKQSKDWDNSLVILVPDHLGAYPDDIEPYTLKRFHIPMIWTGGALASKGVNTTFGSQQDIAATLLGQMGIRHDGLPFSKDMLNASARHFAFFTYPDIWGYADDRGYMIYDNKQNKIAVQKGKSTDNMMQHGKAYLQYLYDIIANL